MLFVLDVRIKMAHCCGINARNFIYTDAAIYIPHTPWKCRSYRMLDVSCGRIHDFTCDLGDQESSFHLTNIHSFIFHHFFLGLWFLTNSCTQFYIATIMLHPRHPIIIVPLLHLPHCILHLPSHDDDDGDIWQITLLLIIKNPLLGTSNCHLNCAAWQLALINYFYSLTQ